MWGRVINCACVQCEIWVIRMLGQGFVWIKNDNVSCGGSMTICADKFVFTDEDLGNVECISIRV